MPVDLRTSLREDLGGGRLSDIAYRRVLEALFERRVPAGAFVSQSDLVAITGVPVGPLRDALHILEAEGLLTIHPRSGIQFVKVGLELTTTTYQFRTIIERAAVRIYAETADTEAIEEQIDNHRQVLELLRTRSIGDLHDQQQRLEEGLHGGVIACLNNPLVETSYRRVWNYIQLLRLERKLTAPLAIRSLQEHLQILEACRNQDADAAEAAMQAHFSAALQRALGLF